MKSELMDLDMNDVRKMSLQLAQKVTEKPDMVAFVAKGAYLIGLTMAEYFLTPLIEVEAVRSGNDMKNLLKPMLALFPTDLKVWLRKKEMSSGVHAKNTERSVKINDPNGLIGGNFRSILLVDDSVDTGNTVLSVKAALQRAFPQAHIITAAFFVFEASKSLVTIDYSLYGDTIFSAPWSNDSSYKKEFMAEYFMMKEKGTF